MTEVYKFQKTALINELMQTRQQMLLMGVGTRFDLDGLHKVDADLLPYKFLAPNSEAHTDGDTYYIISDGILVYFGSIDEVDGELTVQKDLDTFPMLTEVSILIGQGNRAKIEELMTEDAYFSDFCTQMMEGLVKSHTNGHVNLNEII